MPLGPALTATSSEEQGGEVIIHALHKCHLKADEWQGQISCFLAFGVCSPVPQPPGSTQAGEAKTGSPKLMTMWVVFPMTRGGKGPGHHTLTNAIPQSMSGNQIPHTYALYAPHLNSYHQGQLPLCCLVKGQGRVSQVLQPG